MPLATLVPETFFEGQATWLLWLITAGAVLLLAVGADRAVSAAARLARFLGLSTVIIGATVVSLGTTTPEAVVSVRAALRGDPGLALGNAVGSIICDTALIFGLCCLITRLPMDRFVLHRHGWLQFGSGALLTVTALLLWWQSGDINEVYIPRWVGLVYLGLLGAYLYVSVRWTRQHPELIPDQAMADTGAEKKLLATVLAIATLGVGLVLVVFGSELMIGSVSVISLRMGVPKEVLAATLVAFGTSLPELVTALASILKGHPGLLVGNIVGADILNVLFVTGASASAVDLKVEPMFFQFMLPVMMGTLLLFRLYVLFGRDRFHRWQGIPLLAMYVLFVAVLAMVYGLPA